MATTAAERGRQLALETGATIRRIREDKGWTQQHLADALADAGYPQPRSVVAKTETGGRPVPLEDLAVYAQVLGVSPSVLLTDDDTAAEAGNYALERLFLGGRLQRTADALQAAQDAVQELQAAYPPVQ